MADVFLSYSQADRARAAQIGNLLGMEWDVWWDVNLYAGTRFRDEIARQLHSARCVVVLWSRTSIRSDWVVDEAEEGKRRGLLVQAVLEDVPPPYGFGSIHCANLRRWTGDPGAEEFAKLTRGVAQFVAPRRRESAPAGTADSTSAAPAVPSIGENAADGESLPELLVDVERIIGRAQGRTEDPSLPSAFRSWRTRATTLLRRRGGATMAARFAALSAQPPVKDRQARVLAEAIQCRDFLDEALRTAARPETGRKHG